MRTFFTCCAVAGVLAGCATNETGKVTQTRAGTSVYGLDDQPQTVVTGTGSLMPGAYGSRPMPTGQFTGRERTNDLIGQRPTLPREADPRELSRSGEPAIFGSGAGTLGQSGILPDRPVSTDTLMETTAQPVGTGEDQFAGQPEGRVDENVIPEQVGGAGAAETGTASSTNATTSPE